MDSKSPGVQPYSDLSRNRPCPHLPSPVPFEMDGTTSHGDKYSGKMCTTPTQGAHCYMPRPLQGPSPYFLINNGEAVQVGKDCNWAIPSPVENKSRSTSPWCYDSTVVQGSVPSFYNLGYSAVPQSWTHGFIKNSVGLSNEHGIPQADLADPMMVMDQDYNGTVPVTTHTSCGIQQPQDSRISSTSEGNKMLIPVCWKDALKRLLVKVSPFKGLPPVTDLLSVLLEKASPLDNTGQETSNTPLKHNTFARRSRTSYPRVKAEPPDDPSDEQKLEDIVKTSPTWEGVQAAEKPKLFSAAKMLAQRQRRQQREREHAIKRSLDGLSELLPWGEEERRPTKNSILLKAIHHIQDLKTKVEKIRDGKRLQDQLHGEIVTPEPQSNDCLSSSAMEKSAVDNTFDGRSELTLIQQSKQFEMHLKQEVDSGDVSYDTYSDDSLSSTDSLSIDPLPSLPSRSTSPRIKRPMNAFMIFSQEHRKLFKEKFPTQDNRKISASLADHWHGLREDQKQPYKDKARELMRKIKEDYPNYKYYDSSKKRQIAGEELVSCSPSKTVKIGSHSLRARSKTRRYGTDFEVPQQFNPGVRKKLQTQFSALFSGDEPPRHEMMTDELQDNSALSYHTRQLPVTSLSSCPVPQLDSGADQEQKEDIEQRSVVNWIQCDGCGTWRMLPDFISLSNLPEQWYCCKTDEVPPQQNRAAFLDKNRHEGAKQCRTSGVAWAGVAGKCRRTYGMNRKSQWCRKCQHKKKCEVGKKVKSRLF